MKKKILVGVIVVIVLVMAGYGAFKIWKHHRNNDHEKTNAEQGTEFSPMQDLNPNIAGMVLVSENELYKLYTDTKTTQIAVWDKKAGRAFYSNPQDSEKDTIASNVNRSELQATINVEYYTSDNRLASTNNYDLSITFGQVEVQGLKDGIRYIYTLEDPEKSFGVVPSVISEERMKSLVLDNLEEVDQRQVRNKYLLDDGVYKLQESATENKIGMDKLNKLFEKAGYTEDDYNIDMEGVESEIVSFTIPMDYRLTKEGLKVSINGEEISERGGAKIYRLEVLKFFGAAGMEAEGSLFVPNGSGALIYFNNGKQHEASYNQYVYGMDLVSQSYTVIENTQLARMPIFGIINESDSTAVLGIIENGDALSAVRADVSGRLNSYNYVYPEFSVREMEMLNMFGLSGQQSNVPSVEKDNYSVNYSVLYTFLQGEDANYSGMARCYREYLLSNGLIGDIQENMQVPFFLEVLGGAETKEHFMGVPYDGMFAMTTFSEAEQMVQGLHDAGIKTINMTYKGWFNGGVYHDVADKISIPQSLGGKKGLRDLQNKLASNGDTLTLDVAFQKVASNSKRFNQVQEGSKYYSGYVVTLGRVNPTNLYQVSDLGYEELIYVVLSPKQLPEYVGSFLNQYDKKVAGAGIALRDLGDILASDKKRTNVINRQEAKETVLECLKRVEGQTEMLFVAGGNAYAWSVADALTDVPIGATPYNIIDESIPFYQMVIHGRIAYSGNSWNLNQTSDDNSRVLSYIEYGALPKYTMAYEDTAALKYTALADYSSVTYTDWVEHAASTYQTIFEALEPVCNAEMVKHERLNEDLVKVTYSNGVVIYINYSEDQVNIDGVQIDARSYVVKEG